MVANDAVDISVPPPLLPIPIPVAPLPLPRFDETVAYTAQLALHYIRTERPVSPVYAVAFHAEMLSEDARARAAAEVEAAPHYEDHMKRMARQTQLLQTIIATPYATMCNHPIAPMATMVLVLEMIDAHEHFYDNSAPPFDGHVAWELVCALDFDGVFNGLFLAARHWTGFARGHRETFADALEILKTSHEMQLHWSTVFGPDAKTLPPLFDRPEGQRTTNPGFMHSSPTQVPLTHLAVLWAKFLVKEGLIADPRRGLEYLRALCRDWRFDPELTKKVCAEAFGRDPSE